MTRAAVAIVGVGQTAYSRDAGCGVADLAAEAASLALDDAGLAAAAIDGVITAHGNAIGDVHECVNLAGLGVAAVVQRGGASVISGMRIAERALLEGMATHVVIFRARNGASEMPSSSPRFYEHVLSAFPEPDYRLAFEFPYGASSPVQFFALLCRAHMERYGTTREQLAAIAVDHREKAQRNPAAQTRGRSLTLDACLAARPIAAPLHRYDCCLQTDGAAALIMTTAERARDLRADPVYLAGAGEGSPEPHADFVNREDLLTLGTADAMARALTQAGVGRADIDACMLYDAFTNLVVHQLEELGFCERGDGGPFAAGGAIAQDGALPVNPHGGLLAEAHMLGVNHVLEGVRQLRGECGERQLPGLRHVAVTGLGNFGDAGVAILAEAA